MVIALVGGGRETNRENKTSQTSEHHHNHPTRVNPVNNSVHPINTWHSLPTHSTAVSPTPAPAALTHTQAETEGQRET